MKKLSHLLANPFSTLNLPKGFTLIEVLIVITIIGILATLMMTNLAGGRERARDAKKKAELHELQIALNLYNNTYQQYPTSTTSLNIDACGADGNSTCPCSSSAYFAVGSSCETVFMKTVTKSGSFPFFRYYPCDSGDSYRLKTNLDNGSDPEITESQDRCPANVCGLSEYGSKDYVVCP